MRTYRYPGQTPPTPPAYALKETSMNPHSETGTAWKRYLINKLKFYRCTFKKLMQILTSFIRRHNVFWESLLIGCFAYRFMCLLPVAGILIGNAVLALAVIIGLLRDVLDFEIMRTV